jgi:hypothetical protein
MEPTRMRTISPPEAPGAAMIDPCRDRGADRRPVFDIELAMTYNCEIFSHGRAQRILDQLAMVVEALVAERPIADILKQVEFRQ